MESSLPEERAGAPARAGLGWTAVRAEAGHNALPHQSPQSCREKGLIRARRARGAGTQPGLKAGQGMSCFVQRKPNIHVLSAPAVVFSSASCELHGNSSLRDQVHQLMRQLPPTPHLGLLNRQGPGVSAPGLPGALPHLQPAGSSRSFGDGAQAGLAAGP